MHMSAYQDGDGGAPESSVFSSRNSADASRMRLNSIQKAWTSMNRSATGSPSEGRERGGEGRGRRRRLQGQVKGSGHEQHAAGGTTPLMILLRIKFCRNTHTSRTYERTQSRFSPSQRCLVAGWARQRAKMAEVAARSAARQGTGALAASHPKAHSGLTDGRTSGHTNRFCMYLSLMASQEAMQFVM